MTAHATNRSILILFCAVLLPGVYGCGKNDAPAIRDLTVPPRVWIGTSFEEAEKGLKVGRVVPNSPAARAGFRSGDRLVRIGETGIDGFASLKKAFADLKAFQRAPGELVRDGVVVAINIEPELHVLAGDAWSTMDRDKRCNENCECVESSVAILCIRVWRYQGPGPNGGLLYRLECYSFGGGTDVRLQCGNHEWF